MLGGLNLSQTCLNHVSIESLDSQEHLDSFKSLSRQIEKSRSRSQLSSTVETRVELLTCFKFTGKVVK